MLLAVFTLGVWDVHTYVAVLKRALSRGAPTQQPPRMFSKAAVANFFFTIAGALLVEGSERAKTICKNYKNFLFLDRFLLCSPGWPRPTSNLSSPPHAGIIGMRYTAYL